MANKLFLPRSARGVNRRSFLAASASLATVSTLGPLAARYVKAADELLVDPFTLGIASGDPLPDAVVIWTRLAPLPLEPGGGMPSHPVEVHWEVAEDESFGLPVRAGTTAALPDDGHSVHVDVEGLEPGRDYWYRFMAGGEVSPVGRTRTAPAYGVFVDRFRYVFASCQDYEDGFYTAYDHMAEEEGIDLCVFLGDYIYEGRPKPVGDGVVRSHSGDSETVTLDQYRARYAQYKSDPLLQKAHAAFPWLVTFDDHEVDNDWSADIPQDPKKQPPEVFLPRRAAAFQAYWEHMPLRLRNRPRGADRDGSYIQLYQRFAFGDLIEFNVLDTRQFRSVSEPCGFGTGPICDEILDPSRTMLGDRQEDWLLQGLDRSEARWNVLAQQVPVTQLDVGDIGGEPEFKWDKWDAYPVARQRLFDFLAERQPSNPVVITGDLHDNWVAHLKSDFNDPESDTLASEFVGTSISSDGDGAERSNEGERALCRNEHVLFHNWRRGYVRCDVTSESWITDFRTLPYVEQPGAEIETRATFVLEDRNPEAEQVAGEPATCSLA